MASDDQLTPEEMYEKYRVPELFAPWSKLLLRTAAVRSGESVLDLACGTGIVTRQLAPLVGSSGRVAALDFNASMLDVARGLEPPGGAIIAWTEANVADLPYPDFEFDLATCQQGIQFFPDRIACLTETHRVLRDGGRMVASVWSGIKDLPLYEAMFTSIARRLDVSLSSLTTAWSIQSPGAFGDHFEAAGFHVVDVTTHSLVTRYPSPGTWLRQGILGAAATIPTFREMDPADKEVLIPEVEEDVREVFDAYVEGDHLTFPTTAYIAKAIA